MILTNVTQQGKVFFLDNRRLQPYHLEKQIRGGNECPNRNALNTVNILQL